MSEEKQDVVPEFLVAVKKGIQFYFFFIKIDHDRVGRSNEFYFEVVKNSFPQIAEINVMLQKYREASDNTLYTAKNSEELQNVFNKRKDLIFGMVFETSSWKYLSRTDTEKNG